MWRGENRGQGLDCSSRRLRLVSSRSSPIERQYFCSLKSYFHFSAKHSGLSAACAANRFWMSSSFNDFKSAVKLHFFWNTGIQCLKNLQLTLIILCRGTRVLKSELKRAESTYILDVFSFNDFKLAVKLFFFGNTGISWNICKICVKF